MSVERLTDSEQGYCEMYCENYGIPGCDPETCARKGEVAMYERLKDVEGIVPFDRLVELAFADRAGRCVVLPCNGWFETVFGDQEVFYGIDRNYTENQIREISVDSSDRCTWYDGWKTVVIKGYDENGLDWEFSPEEIGKNVFTTREAAEAALKGEQRGKA